MATYSFLLRQAYECFPFPNENNSLKGKTLSTKETRIYFHVIHDRHNTFKIKTEYTVKPTNWDFSKQRVKSQVSGSSFVNDSLNLLYNSVKSEYNKLRADFPDMKFNEIAENIKKFVKDNVSPVYEKDEFYSVFDEFIEMRTGELSPLTIKKYKTLKASLYKFDSELTFKKIDKAFFDRYIKHLRNLPAYRSRQKNRPEGMQSGLLSDTINKYIGDFKVFLRWADEYNYHENKAYTHSSFSLKKDDKISKLDIVTLKMHELKALYEYDFSTNPRLDKVRDVFCFLCFTGQRWSDMLQVTEEQIITSSDESGNKLHSWKFTSYKTGKDIEIPFTGFIKPAYDILVKYKFKLPIISEQKFNSYLKEAGEEAGLIRDVSVKRQVSRNKKVNINRPLYRFMSSHMGRRTCVSLLLNVERLQIYEVMQITGHSDMKTLQKYLDKDQDALIKSLNNTKSLDSPMRLMKAQ